MAYNQELYDRVIQHLADTRLFEMETQSNNSKAIQRHQGRVSDLLKRNINVNLTPEVSRTMKELNSLTTNAVSDYSSAAITFNTNNLHKSVGGFFAVSKPAGIDMLKEIVGPNVETSRTLTEHFNRIGSGELIRIQGIVGRGLAEGLPHKDIIDNVIKTTSISEHQARSLVRTSITRTQAVAVDKVMTDNSDVVKGFRFTAVLDAKTSSICSSHDGNVYALTEVKYRPPLHWNCRSSLIPVLYAKADLKKNKSPRINQEALDKVPSNKLTGESPAIEDYSGWLIRQPMNVLLKHLGSEEKVALFQQGHLAVKEFFTRAGNEISISVLRRLDNIRTGIFPTRQAALSATVDGALTISASKPYDLIRSVRAQDELRAMYISDANSMNQAMSLVDFKGTSLVGKRTSRGRSNNEFDERNTSFDPFTGEQRSTLLYDPDYSVYQERLDFLKNSKVLTADQKTFITEFTESLEDKVSLNQQSVIVENLRVVFERYARDKRPWDSFMNVLRGESQYSVVNVSRILDRRSRDRAALFDQYMIGEDPKVQIMGEYVSFDDISKNILENQRYVNSWSYSIGREKAREAYYSDTTPLRQFLFDPKQKRKSYLKRLKKWAEKEIPVVKLYNNWEDPTESTLQKIVRTQREKYRNIVDLEFVYDKERSNYISRFLVKKFFGSTNDPSFASDLAEGIFNDARGIDAFANIMGLIADGRSTDYDSLAINIGKTISKEWRPLFPFLGVTMAEQHEAGSRILKALTDQKKIRVISRGKVRRSAIDIDTGRPSGAWQETVSREVSILDKEMLELQKRNRQIIIAQRLGIVNDRDRLYVRPNEKTYFDARGADTGQPIITRRASGNYDKMIVDRDFADMLNHTMSVEYQIDQEFASFIDDVVRFRDPRGNVKKYDELNDFRKLILQRGDQGFGFMQTVKWHLQRNKPFKVLAQIDGRGRVYYQGYLTPTGGEVVRPFLNSGVSRQFGSVELRELAIQLGSMIGPATEALTQAGRFAIFKRNEKEILELGNLLLTKTQRDANIRKFLENHLIRSHEAEGIPKIARMALEYARIHKHVGGDFTNFKKFKPYYTRLMIENDASSSGAQIIGLSTGDRPIAINSNVLATEKKNRLYDLVAMDTASDPEFQSIKALSGANIEWTDLAKAAKAQNMVSFYGAGKATQAASIEGQFAKVLDKKGYTVVTREELSSTLKVIDKTIKDAEYLDAVDVVAGLKQVRKELIEVVDREVDIGDDLIKHAKDIHPDVAEFVDKLTNVRVGLIGPKDFKQISAIMSKHLAERAPITSKFVQFFKVAAKLFIEETQSVDIPWVTFDGKVLYQRFRPKVQTAIDFIDPVTGRRVRNIYQDSVTDGTLIGKSSLVRASIGLGVNGNHMNDAALVRQFHLWGKRNNIGTATIHDAFFTNIGDASASRDALRVIYADALEGETIRSTLAQMRKDGLSEATYRMLLAKAKEDGLIDPPNKITRKDILAPILPGMDWYGIGP